MDEEKFCDRCEFRIGRYEKVKVTADGCCYCFKNNCAYGGIPEEKEVVFTGYLENIFCHKCGKVVSEDRRESDQNDRVFCSDSCSADFYKGVRTCCSCGREIKEGEPYIPVLEKGR